MAGERTVAINRSVNFGSVTVGGTTENVSCPGITAFQQDFGVVTNAEITMPIESTTILVAAISANKDCTVYANAPSTGSPTFTLALKANQPLIYRSTDGSTNWITADITKFYLTTTVATTLHIGIGQDITP